MVHSAAACLIKHSDAEVSDYVVVVVVVVIVIVGLLAVILRARYCTSDLAHWLLLHQPNAAEQFARVEGVLLRGKKAREVGESVCVG